MSWEDEVGHIERGKSVVYRVKMCGLWSLVAAAGAVTAALSVPSAPLRAQVERAPVIGVIDIQGVLRASTAVQALSREVEARRDRTQAEMQGREEALRSADSDLAQRRSALTPQAYAEIGRAHV